MKSSTGLHTTDRHVRQFIHEMVDIVDMAAILHLLRATFTTSLQLNLVHVFIYNSQVDQYEAATGENGLPSSELRFSSTSPLVHALGNTETPFFFDKEDLPPALRPEQARLALLGALLYVPLPGRVCPIGWLALGARRSRKTYTSQDFDFLTQIADIATIAIQRAQLYHQVQVANDARSEFVSIVAHELNNPMTSIQGYTELLSKGAVGPLTELQASYLVTIHSNVERMSTLVSDLNDQSIIEANRLRLDFQPVDLAEVVDEVMRSSRRQIEARKQSSIVKLPAGLPKVWADRTRLAQVLTNLVNNANKYTPEGGTITVSAEKIANAGDREAAVEVLHIWVQDNGFGISPEDQKNIFQKFYRSEDSKIRAAPGTGLGLNITQSLIERMSGRIWFDSEFRQGTTFHFTLPYCPHPPPASDRS